MSRVTHTIESCHIYKWVIEWVILHKWVSQVMSHIWMSHGSSHVTYTNDSWIESCQHRWMSHWMSDITQMSEPSHVEYGWVMDRVMSHIRMSHGIGASISCGRLSSAAAMCVSIPSIRRTHMFSSTGKVICVAACCGVLQCVAVCCSVLHCVAVCCSVLQCVSIPSIRRTHMFSSMGKVICVAVFSSVLQCVAVFSSVLHCVAVCCSVSLFPRFVAYTCSGP